MTVEELLALPTGSIVGFSVPADVDDPELLPALEHLVVRAAEDNYFRDFVSAFVPGEFNAKDLVSFPDVRIIYTHDPSTWNPTLPIPAIR
jgi:hypothetical protein